MTKNRNRFFVKQKGSVSRTWQDQQPAGGQSEALYSDLPITEQSVETVGILGTKTGTVKKTSRRQFIARTAIATTAFAAPQILVLGCKSETPGRSNYQMIDCQSHIFCPELVSLMEKRQLDPSVYVKDGVSILKMGDWLRKIPPHYLDVNVKLAAMDEAGVERTALSINDPGPECFGSDGLAVAHIANDFIAGIVASYPQRFFGLCVLPLQDMSASLIELDRCVNQLNMKGILLYTNIAGRYPDEQEFRPLFARASELDLPVLLHPAKPVTIEQVKAYEMTSSLGNMFDDTIALTRIIMSGMLDEFPKLKLVCPHLGGTLPYFIGRIDHQTQVLKRGPKNLTRAPSEYLRQVWLDIVSPQPLAIKFAYDFMGAERLLFSSDHPWVSPSLIRDCLISLNLPKADETKILRENARLLFNI
ncbi:MAG TPA: amidohydrolase family protein [Bacteroidales bacterium]|nr:amidohydrolase family protein [Bacteroidales bacterium]